MTLAISIVQEFHVAHRKHEFAQKENWCKTGTQCIDCCWQSLDMSFSHSLHLRRQGHGCRIVSRANLLRLYGLVYGFDWPEIWMSQHHGAKELGKIAQQRKKTQTMYSKLQLNSFGLLPFGLWLVSTGSCGGCKSEKYGEEKF